jgi:hypothetical protein
MKDLELTQSVHSPQSSTGVLGLSMDNYSALAIGMFLGDGRYGWPGDASGYGDTVAGNLWGIPSEGWSHFPCQLSAHIPHPIIGIGSPLEGISSTQP